MLRISGQPLEARGVRIEGPVVTAEEQSLERPARSPSTDPPALDSRQPAGGSKFEEVAFRGSGQYGSVETFGSSNQQLANEEGAHAVTEEHQGRSGVLLPNELRELAQVFDAALPSPWTEVPQRIVFQSPRPVPAQVQGAHRHPGSGEPVGEPPVAPGVLAHPVGERQDELRTSHPGGVAAVELQPEAVARDEFAHGESHCAGHRLLLHEVKK